MNKKELLQQLEDIPDDAPVIIEVGAARYDILVITENGPEGLDDPTEFHIIIHTTRRTKR